MKENSRSRESPLGIVTRLADALARLGPGLHPVNRVAEEAGLKWSVASRYVEIIHLAQSSAPQIDLPPRASRKRSALGWQVRIQSADPRGLLLRIGRSRQREFPRNAVGEEEKGVLQQLLARGLVEEMQTDSGSYVRLTSNGHSEVIRIADSRQQKEVKKSSP